MTTHNQIQDVNGNIIANSLLEGYTTTATAAMTTTLTVASTKQQFFTGTTTQTVVLPVTSTLVLGQSFYIVNNSTGVVTVQSSGTNTVQAMAGSTTLLVTCILTSGTTAASWSVEYVGAISGGTVNAGTSGQLGYYAANGSTISGLTLGQGLAIASTTLNVGGANNIPFNNGQGIQDNNGNSLLLFGVSASAVNSVNLTNAATGGTPTFAASGSDTNIALTLKGQGTGGVAVQGTGTNNNAGSGIVGEFISSVVSSGSAVSISQGSATDVTSIILSAGDWDVYGNVSLITNVTTPTNLIAWSNSSSASEPDPSLYLKISVAGATFGQGDGINIPKLRYSVTGSTTIYLSAIAGGASGTGSICGGLYARRVR